MGCAVCSAKVQDAERRNTGQGTSSEWRTILLANAVSCYETAHIPSRSHTTAFGSSELLRRSGAAKTMAIIYHSGS